VIVLLGAMAIFAAISLMFRSTSATATSSQTVAGFATASAALEQFASTAARLPCPADPSADTGDAVPPGPNPTCTFPAGTIPWRTIGMSREDALDAWGWKIGYRVYTGNAGSLTQAEGASLVHCDTNPALPAGKTPLVGNSGGTCRPTHNTRHTDFLVGKGLTVTDFGTAHSDVAYVLVSFGPSGNGGYTSAGLQKQPPPTNDHELANTTATGPFVARASTTTGLQPASANFFDDVLFYRKLTDFVKGANLSARDWPDALAGGRFDTATLAGTLGSAPSYGDLGTATLYLANAHVVGFDASGNQNLSFAQSGSNEGLGVVGGGSNTLSSNGAGEGIRIQMALPARRFAITLNHFGTGDFIIFPYAERVQLTFLNGATTVDTIVKPGCRADGGLASYSVTASGDFNKVEIRPLVSTLFFIDSAFYLSEFQTCAAGASPCTTSLATAANTCP
jgi:hypothetical protein